MFRTIVNQCSFCFFFFQWSAIFNAHSLSAILVASSRVMSVLRWGHVLRLLLGLMCIGSACTLMSSPDWRLSRGIDVECVKQLLNCKITLTGWFSWYCSCFLYMCHHWQFWLSMTFHQGALHLFPSPVSVFQLWIV